jgi:hypothetical protein
MYNGTLIDDLIATVERAEERVRQQADSADLERWYTSQSREMEPALLGVA